MTPVMVGPIGRGDGRSPPGFGGALFAGGRGAAVFGLAVDAVGATGAEGRALDGAVVVGADSVTDGLGDPGEAVSVGDAHAPLASRASTSTDHRRGRMSIRR
jgi:hypothetical protein